MQNEKVPAVMPVVGAPNDGREWTVSSEGVVSVDGRERRQYTSDRGYKRISIGGKTTGVHRIVAAAFIPNPEGLREVNHLDGDKTNNSVSNLEWCTRSQNIKHAFATGLNKPRSQWGEDNCNWGKCGERHPRSMPVRATFPDGRTVDYESQQLAAADGFHPSLISECVSGQRKTHGGATWHRQDKAKNHDK